MKLQTHKEQLSSFRKQSENAEENVRSLQVKITELVGELDATRSQCTQLVEEKEVLHKNLDTIKMEKNVLEKNRMEINAMV